MNITFPDGSIKEYNGAISAMQIAEGISPQFQKECIGVKINETLLDLSTLIDKDSTIEFITTKKETKDSLDIIRHSTAHLLAHAVKELFPKVQIGIGPVIENGFYYDFLTEKPFSSKELQKIKEKMHEIASRKYNIEKTVVQREKVIDLARKENEKLKELIIDDIPDEEDIKIYSQGDFSDICRGPHVPNTSFLKNFDLIKVSGSYWKGNSKNKPMQRIYGTAWIFKKSLEEYLTMLEEASLRDHRKIGQELNLFHQQQEASGDIFWHPNGYSIFLMIQDYIRKMLLKDYKEIKTPQLLNRKLWEQSGHWNKFKSNMFTLNVEDMNYALKPMSCPGHVQVFKNSIYSYRDLPIRMSEFGCCHRWEPSGATYGIMRVRAFTQDDAHIFCTAEQIQGEAIKFIKLLQSVYKDFGFNSILVKLSTRPDQREGEDKIWDISEKALENAVKSMGIEFSINKGEGAFYGPKLEFVLKDAIGRDWQCGTLQVDMVLPNKLEAYYTDQNGNRVHPVMLHRAILGSIERFMGILIENYAGKFSFWLAPIQVVVCSITSEQDESAKELHEKLLKRKIRSKLDIKTETMGHKIRYHISQKIPYISVIGKKEVAEGTISLRARDSNKNITVTIEELFEIFDKEFKPSIFLE